MSPVRMADMSRLRGLEERGDMRSLAELDDSSIRIIAESDPGDIAIYELADGKLLPLFTADGLAEFSGMDKEEYDEVIRKDATVLISEVDRDTIASLIEKILHDGEDADCTYRVVNRDEGLIWVHARGRIVGSRNGHPVLMVSYSRTSSEASALSQLLDVTSSIVYVIDEDSYELLFANRYAFDIWGHGDFVGQPCYRYINDRSEPCPWCSVPLMQDGCCHFDAASVPSLDMWFSVDCHEIDWHGRAAVAISTRDVTTQEMRRRGLEQDRDDLESILGHIPGGVALFSEHDGEIRLDYTNAGFYEVHPGPRGHWVSLGPDPLKWLVAEDRHIFEDELHAVISGGKPQGDATYRVIDGQGRYHWVNNRFRSAYERNGVRYFYASFTNLDTQKAAEASKNEAYRMYEQAVEEAKLVVWEYDILDHRVIMSENEFTRYDYRKFGLPKVTENAPQSLLPYIDDEYVDAFLEMYRRIDEGAPTATCEIWYKMQPEMGRVARRSRIRPSSTRPGSRSRPMVSGRTSPLRRLPRNATRALSGAWLPRTPIRWGRSISTLRRTGVVTVSAPLISFSSSSRREPSTAISRSSRSSSPTRISGSGSSISSTGRSCSRHSMLARRRSPSSIRSSTTMASGTGVKVCST